MSEPWAELRQWIESPADAVRWACGLEMTAPKLGNVHLSQSFVDLSAAEFLIAAEELAIAVSEHRQVGAIVLAAVRCTVGKTRSNVNLGIALLLAPLALAAERIGGDGSQRQQRGALEQVLAELTPADSRDVYAAIRLAKPGGLGTSAQLDVRGGGDGEASSPPAPDRLLDAMQLARDRDSIARQYVSGFADIYDSLLPRLADEVAAEGDLLMGIRSAQLHHLAEHSDTLIARKCGPAIAAEVRSRAAAVLASPRGEERRRATREFDQWLRADGNRRNPGTTADMIAASLFVLLTTTRSV